MNANRDAHDHIDTLVANYPDLKSTAQSIHAAFHILSTCYTNGGKLLVCGNGGSASDAEHIVGELMKGFTKQRRVPSVYRDRLVARYGDEGRWIAGLLQGALPAISLSSHAALTTAIGNDIDGRLTYAQQVFGYGKPEDVLLAISTSGNSNNVIQAVRVANVMGISTVALTGMTGGELRKHCDVSICVPYHTTSQIQERHLPIYHALCTALEEHFFHDDDE